MSGNVDDWELLKQGKFQKSIKGKTMCRQGMYWPGSV